MHHLISTQSRSMGTSQGMQMVGRGSAPTTKAPGFETRHVFSPRGKEKPSRICPVILPPTSVQTMWVITFFFFKFIASWGNGIGLFPHHGTPRVLSSSQETHSVSARRNPGADANTCKLGKGDVHPERESWQSKPDVTQSRRKTCLTSSNLASSSQFSSTRV